MKTPTALAALALVLTTTTAADTTDELAIDVLDNITIAEDHPMDDYDRDTFAPSGWIDANDSGCTTREDILARDLEDTQIDGCTVEYGQTIGAYSGEPIEHIQGESQIDVEHVTAVAQAHRNGAHEWDEETQQAFYQDPENLIAVSATENQSKGSRDVTEYMPPNQGAYCTFTAAKVYIKDKYDLAMNPEEHAFITDVLNDPECEGTPSAPAQAIYTTDWDAEPTSNTNNDLTELIENTNPLILLGIAALALIALITLIASPRARKTLGRSAKRSARRSVRRGVRSTLRG